MYLSEDEAWVLVSKACSNGNYGYHEEFQKLPDIVRKAVGNEMNIHKWAAVPQDEFQTVIGSNFKRSYRSAVNTAKEQSKWPNELKQLVNAASRKLIEGARL